MSLTDNFTIPEGLPNSTDPGPDVPQPYSAEPFLKAPRDLLRDSTLKPAARLLLLILLDRQHRTRPWTLLRRELLADDLGVSPSTVDRLIADLIEAGRVETRRTRDGLLFRPQAPEPGSRVVTGDESRVVKSRVQSRQIESPESSETYIAKHLDRSIDRASKQEAPDAAAPDGRGRAAPAEDPLAVEETLLLLPARRRPEASAQVSAAISAALARGWTPRSLAAAIQGKITNPEAGPGLTVRVLQELAQQPPTEHHSSAAVIEVYDWQPGWTRRDWYYGMHGRRTDGSLFTKRLRKKPEQYEINRLWEELRQEVAAAGPGICEECCQDPAVQEPPVCECWSLWASEIGFHLGLPDPLARDAGDWVYYVSQMAVCPEWDWTLEWIKQYEPDPDEVDWPDLERRWPKWEQALQEYRQLIRTGNGRDLYAAARQEIRSRA